MVSYFLLDTSHQDYADLIEQCRTEHVKNAPGCLLSAALNAGGTRALVKVAGVNRTWLNSAAVVDKSEKADHSKFVEMVYGDLWRTLPPRDGGNPSSTHNDTLDGGAV